MATVQDIAAYHICSSALHKKQTKSLPLEAGNRTDLMYFVLRSYVPVLTKTAAMFHAAVYYTPAEGLCFVSLDNFLQFSRYFIESTFTDRVIPADGISAAAEICEALVGAVIQRGLIAEDCDLVAERMTLIRTEDRAVAAFVADAVDMDHLLLPVDFQIFVAAVRAGFYAHAAESAAFQTAGRITRVEVRVEDRALAQTGIFTVQNSVFRIIRSAKFIHSLLSRGDSFDDCLRSGRTITDDLDLS